MSSSRTASFKSIVLDGIAPTRAFTPEARTAFGSLVSEFNQRSVRMFVPLLAVMHLLMGVGLLGVPQGKVTAVDELWYAELLTAHRVMLPTAIVLIAAAWMIRPGSVASRWLGVAATFAYMAFAVAVATIDQRIFPSNVGALVIATLGTAGLFRLGVRTSSLAYLAGVIAFNIAITHIPMTGPAAASACATSVTVSLLAWMLSRSTVAAMAREFAGRRVIEEQSAQLAKANGELDALNHAQEKLNSELERQVNEQVGEIVKNAEQVDVLNKQLQERVRERSRELSTALARLAGASGGETGLLDAGTVLGDRVVIERLLGRGGMGTVYVGRDRASGQRVAVKVVQAASSQQLDGLHRFLREANVTASLSHPAIVRSLHVDVSDDGRLFQVLELVDGETLCSVLARLGQLPPPVAARVLAQVAAGLAAAHHAGVVHRDVKPANIMLTATAPGVKLLDFGVSKLRDTVGPESGPSTRQGFVVGTPEYMAPEQVAATPTADGAADVYALGVVLFHTLTGRLPFDAKNAPAFMHAHAYVEPHRVDKFAPNVPQLLGELVARCLAKEPSARPTATELASTLERFADEERTPAAEKLGIALSGQAVHSAAATMGAVVTTAETREIALSGPLGKHLTEAAAARTEVAERKI